MARGIMFQVVVQCLLAIRPLYI